MVIIKNDFLVRPVREDNFLGQCIRNAREHKEIPLRVFAKMIEVKPSSLTSIERGEVNISGKLLIRIAHSLGWIEESSEYTGLIKDYESVLEENEELRKRLEINTALRGDGVRIDVSGDPDFPDGVQCRNVTIKHLEEKLASFCKVLHEIELNANSTITRHDYEDCTEREIELQRWCLAPIRQLVQDTLKERGHDD